ncbi:MAG: T9SS type A sorting domain-containing protein [Bacteroidales bacterium]|nr:T9SS type A sorting domain-containing protein [Bacteroidales bacterium]
MKKILLSALSVIITVSLYSQSLSLFFNGEPIAHGATVQVLGNPTDDYMQAKAAVKNNSANAIEVMVKKHINADDTLPNTMNVFCWGSCFPPNTYVSPFSILIGPDQVNDTSFYGDYFPNGVIGITRISYIFFDMNNENDSVAFTVEYNASPASVAQNLLTQVNLSDAYPNPAISVVNFGYRLPEDTRKSSIIISNILGARIKEVQLTGVSGKTSIPVGDMVNGVYFYSLCLDDRVVITRKFVVKR